MPRSYRHGALAAVTGSMMAILAAGTATADTLTTNWPGLPPAGISMCLGEEQTFTYQGVLSRSFSAPNYSDGQTVAFTVAVTSDDLSPVTGSMPDNTIALPADWTSLPFGTAASDTVTIELAITATKVGVDDFIVDVLDESLDPNPFGTLIRLTIVDCGGATPTPSPTATASPTATPSSTPTPTPGPTGGVAVLSPPPTDAPDGTSDSTDVPLPLGWLAVAGAGMLALGFMRARIRRSS